MVPVLLIEELLVGYRGWLQLYQNISSFTAVNSSNFGKYSCHAYCFDIDLVVNFFKILQQRAQTFYNISQNF